MLYSRSSRRASRTRNLELLFHVAYITSARLAVAVCRTGVDGRRVVRRILDLEERVAAHRVVHFLSEVERRQLQQAHCVLQPRRDGVLLTLARLEAWEIHRAA